MLFRNLALAVALTGLLAAVQPAAAQQMGNGPYNFPLRNPSLSAQFDFQERMTNENSDELGALNQFVTTYSSTSTSIGNMNTITQILSGGSTGSVGQSTDQQSTGNQGSEATSDIEIDNSIVSTLAGTDAPAETE